MYDHYIVSQDSPTKLIKSIIYKRLLEINIVGTDQWFRIKYESFLDKTNQKIEQIK